VLPTVSVALGILVALAFLLAAWVSWREGEARASFRLVFVALPVSVLYLLPILLPESASTVMAGMVSLGTVALLLFFLVPVPGRGLPELGTPVPGVDERDIMFSRAALAPGTERFREYYRRRPENREPDDGFRKEAGLLSGEALHFHPLSFSAADAAFWTIEKLRPFVEGDAPAPMPAPAKLGGERVETPSAGSHHVAPEEASRFLKEWAGKMGAHSVGVAELEDYHLYSHVGRGPEYGEPVRLEHTHALALTVEMDREMVDRAPRAPTVMESAHQYLRSGVMAIQLADTIRRWGFSARAHVDGSYRVICPLVARDAGLGELGRMGLLMTPDLGPRVRIAVVTTDLPLTVDGPAPDGTTVDFCLRCRKCAEVCPSRALPFGDPAEDENGVLRWKIDAEACFTLWARLGTDCARCMSVCPYSHPDNVVHSLVRWGIKNNSLFRRASVRLDDLVYGRRPPPKGPLDWMEGGAGPV
jgi:ferredoxin